MRNHLYSCNEAQDSGDFGVGRKPVVSIPPTTPRELTCGASPACRPPRARRGSSSRSPLALLAGLVKLFDPAAQAALTDPGRRACAICAALGVPRRPCSPCARACAATAGRGRWRPAHRACTATLATSPPP
jgi:hypothetical protein